METRGQLKRLKRLSETKIEELQEMPEITSDHSSISSASADEHSDTEAAKTKLKKNKIVKNKAPKLPKFNKLLDFNTVPEDFSVNEFEFLRDAPLDLQPKAAKPLRKSFLSKLSVKEQDSASYSLAKSVLINRDEKDTLVVNNPLKVKGFITKSVTSNPREVFRDTLKSVINQKKTKNMNEKEIFEKNVTDFHGKDEGSLGKGEETKNASSENTGKVAESSWISGNFNKNFGGQQVAKEEIQENQKKVQKSITVLTYSNENPCNPADPKAKSNEPSCFFNKIPEPATINYESSKSLSEEKKTRSYPSTSASSPVYVPLSHNTKTNFLENEAEKSGEDHSSDTNEENLDSSLKDLIDDQKFEEDDELNYAKHVKDMLEKDCSEIKKVINADFAHQNFSELFSAKKRQKISEAQVVLPEIKVFSKGESDSEEEKMIHFLKERREIKNIRKLARDYEIIDEKSTDYLKLMEKPDNTRSVKTLLNIDHSKSSSLLKNSEVAGNPFFKVSKNQKAEEIPKPKAPERPKNNLIFRRK